MEFYASSPVNVGRISRCLFLTLITSLIWVAQGHAEYRTIDGTGNNLQKTALGSANTPIARILYDPFYPGDKKGTTMLAPPDAPNARAASNSVDAIFNDRLNTQGRLPNARGLSDYIWQWGQFVTHDLDLTPNTAANGVVNISVPTGDPLFDPNSTGTAVIPFQRSDFTIAPLTGIREQTNRITSYIDASNVYGSDAVRAKALRTGHDGQMAVGSNFLPTFNVSGLPNDNQNPTVAANKLFLVGDVRGNEQVGLTALHTVFLREHNRLAAKIAVEQAGSLPTDPVARDEELYQQARRLVGAEMQIITYKEFLPALMGDTAPKATDYVYTPTIDPSITQSFSHALFRFGHSMNSATIPLLNRNGTSEPSLSLRTGFFNPDYLVDDPQNIDRLLRGMTAQIAEENDLHVVNELRNFMFGSPGAGGLDLMALDIQRGRDHGLPSYNANLVAYLGPTARRATVDKITSDPEIQQALIDLYDIDTNPNNIDKIDLIVGALAEDHVAGSLGPSMADVIGKQFIRTRNGDRFFYLGSDAQLYDKSGTTYALKDSIRQVLDLDTVTLGQIIRWNTDVGRLPDNVFFATAPIATPLGDFDGDNQLGADDIDRLSDRVNNQFAADLYDVNNDGSLNDDDRWYWVEHVKKTYVGDANLDGLFNAADLTSIAASDRYENTLRRDATWISGDWNGDREFTTDDLLIAFQRGGLRSTPRAAIAQVPEPASLGGLALAALLLLPQIPQRRTRTA